MRTKDINTTALAFMGDAVYEVHVRREMMKTGVVDSDKLHRMAVAYVKAGAQATVIKRIFDTLTDEEQALVKRARNHKFNTKAKSATPMEYKWATAFEALIGYLYLEDQLSRMREIIETAIRIIKEENEG